METTPTPPLPSRATMDRSASLARLTPKHKIGMARMLLIAAVLAIAVDIAIPRPSVVLENTAYVAPGCTGNPTVQPVTATFTLVNRGTVDTVVDVTLSVDGNPWMSATYGVPALGSTPGVFRGGLPDCAAHSFDLTFRYDSPGAA